MSSFSPRVATAVSPQKPSWRFFMSTSEKVPLFIAKTSILSQRSSAYVNTHSAVHEFIDNSIEAGAKRVYVYYLPRRQGNRVQTHDIVVLDDGRGMTQDQ